MEDRKNWKTATTSIKLCEHKNRTRYVSGFRCGDCNVFFNNDSPTYRSGELLSDIWMVLHNINIDSRRAGDGDIEEMVKMQDKIGIRFKHHNNYEELIEEAEIIMKKYKKNAASATVVMKL